MSQTLTFFFAFVAVLALIGAVAWLIRRFASNRLGANTQRGRMPRLAVIDAAAVDGRRRLVLVRRDNIEHLLMIGGPTDIVVEPNIVRATSGRDQLPPRPAVASPDGAQPARIVPLPDAASWGEPDAARPEPLDHAEPQMPEPPPRPARPAFADEVRRPARAERGDPLTGFGAEPMGGRAEPRPEPPPVPRMPPRSEPVMPRPARPVEAPKPPPIRQEPRQERPQERPQELRQEPRQEPRQERPAAPPPAPAMSSADQNLAEMAQRLEAALRRPPGEPVAPPVAPEAPVVVARAAPRNEPPAPPPAPAPAKSGFDNLEDEMASLLGRPKNPS
jgi:flagellar protein FliO/FliZ